MINHPLQIEMYSENDKRPMAIKSIFFSEAILVKDGREEVESSSPASFSCDSSEGGREEATGQHRNTMFGILRSLATDFRAPQEKKREGEEEEERRG